MIAKNIMLYYGIPEYVNYAHRDVNITLNFIHLHGGYFLPTQDEYISMAEQIYKRQHTYEKTNYRFNKKRITITCKLHGDFEKLPRAYLLGKGCPTCDSMIRKTNHDQKQQSLWLEQIKQKHGDKYDYKNAFPLDKKGRMKIICPIHGKFFTTPIGHIYGSGCYTCNVGWTKAAIIRFLQSLERNFPNLSQQQYYLILQQSKILSSEHGKRMLLNGDNILKGFLNKKPRHSKVNTPKNILDELKTKKFFSSDDNEAIEYMVCETLNKLWSYAYANPNLSTEKIMELINE